MLKIAARSGAPQIAAFYGLVACHPALDMFLKSFSSTNEQWINLTYFFAKTTYQDDHLLEEKIIFPCPCKHNLLS